MPVKLLFPTKVFNKEALIREGGSISVSNHLCYADVMLVAVNMPGYRRFMAKKEIGKNKFIHACAVKLGIIFVDRGKADLTAIRTSMSALKAGENLGIFPEGTRNRNDESLQEVKSGAAMLAIKAKTYVQPIMIHHRAKVFRKNYMYVAPAFRLSEFEGELLDTEALSRAAETVSAKMLEAKNMLDELVSAKKNRRKKKREGANV